jgi:hypothetical protein
MMDNNINKLKMDKVDPFNENLLSKIFRISSSNPECLAVDEGISIEFKENFSMELKDDYSKTLASYANADGGYILFGVSDGKKRMVGLNSDNFKNRDPAKITIALREFLVPDIKWYKYVHEFKGRVFGLIYVEKAAVKPVIIIKNGRDVKEGDIYYRYPGQSLRIRYPELRQIIEEERLKRIALLEKQVKKMMEIGIENVGILDTNTGEVTGPRGSFLIDETTLPKINFIKEGEFSEKQGAPALRLIGEVSPIDPGKIQPVQTIIKPTTIRTPDIVHAFLDQEDVLDPIEYIKQICFERSVFLPIYYFMGKANLSNKATMQIIMDTQSMPDKRDALLNRLSSNDKSLKVGLGAGSDEIKELILSESIDPKMPIADLEDTLQTIMTLNRSEINDRYLYNLLKEWFDVYYPSDSSDLRNKIRRAICYIDKKINGEKN